MATIHHQPVMVNPLRMAPFFRIFRSHNSHILLCTSILRHHHIAVRHPLHIVAVVQQGHLAGSQAAFRNPGYIRQWLGKWPWFSMWQGKRWLSAPKTMEIDRQYRYISEQNGPRGCLTHPRATQASFASISIGERVKLVTTRRTDRDAPTPEAFKTRWQGYSL